MGRGDEDKEKERKGWGRGKGAGMEMAKEEGVERKYKEGKGRGKGDGGDGGKEKWRRGAGRGKELIVGEGGKGGRGKEISHTVQLVQQAKPSNQSPLPLPSPNFPSPLFISSSPPFPPSPSPQSPTSPSFLPKLGDILPAEFYAEGCTWEGGIVGEGNILVGLRGG